MDWAKQVRDMDADSLSAIVEDSSLESNCGLVVPTGSKRRHHIVDNAVISLNCCLIVRRGSLSQ